MQADWDPQQYERFARERAQPFWDLAAIVATNAAPGSIRRGHDLGCGTGELTAGLAERLVVADMIGSDSSPAMLERAAAYERPGLHFETVDLATWTSDADHDLVFANASLQWVPDHAAVVARWWAALAPGGHLAVQVPANADHPSHTVVAEVAASAPFVEAMGASAPADAVASNVLTPERYAEMLHGLGAARQHARLQVYGHVLDSSSDVVEWATGTSLTRIFKVLPAALRGEFVDAYRTRLLDVIGDNRPYFYPFKRILLWAQHP